ncbi:hypothetical protein DM793_03760 [Paenarthrobacter nitroguajacolicus]|uniref:helix-turn-helix transcriptional regulator n=1 Tax=Paenarthrobacter nitroguajacolicus TaxID=211146 RepID=UPI001D5A2DF1|nr:hypothetical protein [Paenarthrobacter nitroguajacolicus]
MRPRGRDVMNDPEYLRDVLMGRAAGGHPLFATVNRVVAERHGGRLIGPHQLIASPGTALNFYHAALSSCMVFGLYYGGQTTVTPRGPADHHTLVVTLQGQVTAASQRSVSIGTPGSLLITRPSPDLRLTLVAGTAILGVRIPNETLQKQLTLLSGVRTVDFRPLSATMEASPGTATVLALLRQVVGVFEVSRALPPALLGALEDSLLTSVLLNVPGEHVQVLTAPPPAGSRAVYEAAEMMNQLGEDCPPLQDLADQVGVSLRRLQAGFRNVFGVTPSQYLRNVRIDRVHEQLMSTARDATSVGELASAAGFNHLGRFSMDYRRRFGISPAETLRSEPKKSKLLLPGEKPEGAGSIR